MKKRLLVWVLVLIMVPTVVFASAENIKVQKNTANIIVNGEKISVDNFVYNGVTYVPLRAVSENMNASVDWNNDSKTASIESKVTPILTNISDKNDIVCCYMLRKISAQTKDLTNAAAVHFLTSENNLTTLNQIKPYSDQTIKYLLSADYLFNSSNKEINALYDLVFKNASNISSLIDTAIEFKVTSVNYLSDTSLDECEKILNNCDNTNQRIDNLVKKLSE